MTEKTKNELAIRNDLLDERKKMLVIQRIGEEFSITQEIGLLGDTLQLIFNIMLELHPSLNDNEKFKHYRTRIADIKQRIYLELGIEKQEGSK